MARTERTGWGINPAEPDENPRRCPDCGVVLAAGHARCRPCFLRLEAEYQRKTERDWMRRNFPEFRPRDLFPEDYWEQTEIKNTSVKEGR